MNTTQVTINGTTYDILSIDTAETHDAEHRPNVANLLRDNGITRDMHVVRVNGSKVHHVYEFGTGRFSKVTSVFFSVTAEEKAEMQSKLVSA